MSSAESTSENEKPGPRQFSLRTLLIAVAVLAVLLAWIGYEVRQRLLERRIVAICVQLGASISYTGKEGGKVTGLHFSDYSDLSDEHLKQLAGLTHLRKLNLNTSKVTGSGLAALADFRALRELHVNGDQLTDDGIRHLKRLSRLQELRFFGTNPDDPRIKEVLQALPNVDVHY